MPPDPKSPEAVLSDALDIAVDALVDATADVEPRSWSASREAEARCKKAIDRLASIARLVGRIEQRQESVRVLADEQDYANGRRLLNGARIERDRLLAELAAL